MTGTSDCNDATSLFRHLCPRQAILRGTRDDLVDSLVTDDVTVVLTSVAVIETVSAFRRKYNRDDIDDAVLNDLIASFFEEALSDFLILPTEESLLVNSFDLILHDDLRTLDSLQLSAALGVSEDVENAVFVCADRELVSIAESRGLETINPDEANATD